MDDAELKKWRESLKDAPKVTNHNQWDKAAKDNLMDKIKKIFGKGDPSLDNLPNEAKNILDNLDPPDGSKDWSTSSLEKHFTEINGQLKEELIARVRNKIEQNKKEYMEEIERRQRENLYKYKGDVKEVVDWKKLLIKTIIKETDYWSYRRSDAENDYMARVGTYEEPIKSQTEVMLDVSSSVDITLLKEFLRQLKPLFNHTHIKVGFFDDEATPFTEIKKISDIDNMKIRTGGGTNLDCAVRAFSRGKGSNKINKIIFTDGYGMMPREDLKNVKNLIWLLYDHTEIDFHPVCGKVIYVDTKSIYSQNNNAKVNLEQVQPDTKPARDTQDIIRKWRQYNNGR